MSQFYYNWFLMCKQNGTVTDSQLLTARDRGMLTEEEYSTIINLNSTNEPPTT